MRRRRTRHRTAAQHRWPKLATARSETAPAAFTPPASWPEQLTQRWKVEVGLGYSAPIVAGDRVFAFSRQDDNEVMRGARRRHRQDDSGRPSTPPRSSPIRPPADARHRAEVDAGICRRPAHTLGLSGIVSAFDAASGKLLWQKPPAPVEPLYHTRCSPLVDRGLVTRERRRATATAR